MSTTISLWKAHLKNLRSRETTIKLAARNIEPIDQSAINIQVLTLSILAGTQLEVFAHAMLDMNSDGNDGLARFIAVLARFVLSRSAA